MPRRDPRSSPVPADAPLAHAGRRRRPPRGVRALHPDPMEAALRAARRGQGRVSPNPMVGAALLWPDGHIQVDYHRSFGGAHAEARLLDRAVGSGRLPPGAVLFVTLEPCCHQGKTPPCIDRVLRARPSRVVIAGLDSDPRTRGRGVDRLRAHRIPVEIGPGELDALVLNLAFHLRHRLGRSLIRVKLASSLDARLASGTRGRRWITGEAARRQVHRERALADAVVVGSGTILADDPELTVRGARGPDPSRIVVDSALRTPAESRVWRAFRERLEDSRRGAGIAGGPGSAEAGIRPRGRPEEPGVRSPGRRGKTWVLGNFLRKETVRGFRYQRSPRLILATRGGWEPARLEPYRRAGWEVWEIGRGDRVPLRALARRAAREGFLSLLAEAGPGLTGALLNASLVDELSLYLAPVALGGSLSWPAEGRLPKGGCRFELIRQQRIEEDCWLLYRREGLLPRLRASLVE